jgi:hypothetical protein
MILVYLENIETSENILISASKLANQLGKSFGVVSSADNEVRDYIKKKEITELLNNLKITDFSVHLVFNKIKELCEFCEKIEASFLFLQLSNYKSRNIQSFLTACRNLRIPYLLFKDNYSELHTAKVIVPITFLEEEIEKAQFASAFGRFCNSEIQLLPAKDFGSKAAITKGKMIELFEKFDFKFKVQIAEKDSFQVEKEALLIANKENAGIIIVSASREYGLDDILFGPKELHIIKKSVIPVLLVNPRGDLYALCD